MYLPRYVTDILDILKAKGYEGYAVGGCVRDALLGKIPDDYDITLSCPPEKTAEIFKDYRVIETGIKHGTVTVISDSHPLELTTFRCDGEYKDNRHPEKVIFTGRIEDDLARRDFTVNAMAYSPDTGLVDLFGGRDDLKNGIIRCVGEPEKRFSEDALRIMRGVRFASVLGFEIEEKTLCAAMSQRQLLENISAERIYTELKKLLCGKNSLQVLKNYGKIISAAVPGIENLTENGNFDSLALIDEAGDISMKLTLFLRELGAEKADAVLCRLKSDNRQRKTTAFLLKNEYREFLSVGEVLRFAGENGIERLKELFVFRSITGNTHDTILKQGIEKAFEKNTCLKISDLALKGNDLQKLGYSGREIGEKLSELLKAVTEGQCENTVAALTEFAGKNL